MSDIIISFDCSGEVYKSKREHKGKSLTTLPLDFTVLDLETTGLEPAYDDIIEFAAIKVRDGKIVDSYSSLVHLGYKLDEFIVELTGITDEMLANAPEISEVLKKASDFIGNDVVVGHNVNFDINFLYDSFNARGQSPFKNDFIDTMRYARKLFPDEKHHRLKDMVKILNVVNDSSHRALSDCRATLDCYLLLRDKAIEMYGDEMCFCEAFNRYKNFKASAVQTDKTNFDESHPLFGKICVFTGKLNSMIRADAAKAVVDVGGICGDSVTKDTNYLILGNNDYCSSIKDGKSHKQKKAEEYKLKGRDIEVISEQVFIDMLR